MTGYGLLNFLVPAKLAAGGVSGLATIIYYYFKFPVGWSTFIINIPIFIVGVFAFGRTYVKKSIFGIVMLSVNIAIIDKYFVSKVCSELSASSPVIGSTIGGIIVGLGLGIALGLGSNTGGTAIVAQILNKYLDIKVGTCLIIADAFVITAAAFAFGIKSAFLAGISLLFTGKIINFIVEKLDSIKIKA